jgi:hypothetical protein
VKTFYRPLAALSAALQILSQTSNFKSQYSINYPAARSGVFCVMPDLIRHPVRFWIPASAGMTAHAASRRECTRSDSKNLSNSKKVCRALCGSGLEYWTFSIVWDLVLGIWWDKLICPFALENGKRCPKENLQIEKQ